jgi:hypothetical protein
MSERPFSRRDFLLSIGVAGAATAALSACGDGRDTPPPATDAPGTVGPGATAPGATTPGTATPADGAGLTAAECSGYAELTEDDHTIRRTLNYVDVSPREGQYCNNCRFLIESAEYNPCLGCQLFAGPVAPRGWCSSWVALT